MLERGLAINDVVLGVDHEITIKSRGLISELYAQQGFFDKAYPLLEDIVNTRERVHGADHRSVAEALIALAGVFVEQVICRQRPLSFFRYQGISRRFPMV